MWHSWTDTQKRFILTIWLKLAQSASSITVMRAEVPFQTAAVRQAESTTHTHACTRMQQVHTLTHCNSPDAEELMFLMMSVRRMKGLKRGSHLEEFDSYSPASLVSHLSCCLLSSFYLTCLIFQSRHWAQNKSLNSSYIYPFLSLFSHRVCMQHKLWF